MTLMAWDRPFRGLNTRRISRSKHTAPIRCPARSAENATSAANTELQKLWHGAIQINIKHNY